MMFLIKITRKGIKKLWNKQMFIYFFVVLSVICVIIFVVNDSSLDLYLLQLPVQTINLPDSFYKVEV